MTLPKNKSSNNNNNSQSFHECADCGSSNPQWASLNHGVLICDDCCLAHRTLGRCISIIKSLRKSYWPQSLIDTIYELVRSNSNQIWEAGLNHSSDGTLNKLSSASFKHTKKPTIKDSNSNRLNFIKMKYENLAFITRSKYTSIEDLNQQLFASVKTNNYEATLRILSQGADANYRNQEDGLLCIHRAVLSNQLGQIELLSLYGADVTALDRNGKTPYELAKLNNFTQIADRLMELQFELTDEISSYLCNKRPDHKSGQHFLVPDLLNEMIPNRDDTNKLKLTELADHLFEELCKDVYDELDRRQLETIWKSTVQQHLVNEPIPFLVIKSCFSQTRNQLRQKLARFSLLEFSGLIYDILLEARRRYFLYESTADSITDSSFVQIQMKKNHSLIRGDMKPLKEEQNENEEDPLYDRVPSDEDYASVASDSESTMKKHKNGNGNRATKKEKSKSVDTATNTIELTAATKSTTTTSPPSMFGSKEHKVLTTNFDKPPMVATAATTTSSSSSNITNNVNQASLVANAESTLNSIINSLNQINYAANVVVTDDSCGDSCGGGGGGGSRHPNVEDELRSENQLMQSLIQRLMEENAQLRAERMLLDDSNANANANISANNEINLYSTVKNSNTNGSLKKLESIEDLNGEPKLIYDNNNKLSNIDAAAAPAAQVEKASMDDQKDIILSFQNKLKYFEKKSSSSPSTSNNNENEYENSNYYHQDPLTIDETLSSNCKSILKIVERNVEHDGSQITNCEKYVISASSNSIKNQINNQFQHLKLSPSKSMTSPSRIHQYNSDMSTTAHSSILMCQDMPSKDCVIKKMKKITKSVQELFKATKDLDFVKFRPLCDRVDKAVQEMLVLFPDNLNSMQVAENLTTLKETCKNLTELVDKYHLQIDSFVVHSHENQLLTNDQQQQQHVQTDESVNNNKMMSTSSSSSSAISTGSACCETSNQNGSATAAAVPLAQQLVGGQQDSASSGLLKNLIVSNLVTYSYDIAFTVKRIVCIMGAEN